MKPVVVIGSSNTDLVLQVGKLPAPGETVSDGQLTRAMGGKGANQAVAAARLGTPVKFISAVGNDTFGSELRSTLISQGIDCEGVAVRDNTATGTALIFVDAHGENVIGVAPGANAELLPHDLEKHQSCIQESSYMLLQLELPIETVIRAVDMAAQSATPAVLNAAPFDPRVVELLPRLDTLIVNQVEASQVYGLLDQQSWAQHSAVGSAASEPTVETLDSVSGVLMESGLSKVVITLGAYGAYCRDRFRKRRGGELVRAHKVPVVDTVGAGDTFCGALVSAFCEGANLKLAMEFAQKAAAISITQLGAQSAMPTREEIKDFRFEKGGMKPP